MPEGVELLELPELFEFVVELLGLPVELVELFALFELFTLLELVELAVLFCIGEAATITGMLVATGVPNNLLYGAFSTVPFTSSLT